MIIAKYDLFRQAIIDRTSGIKGKLSEAEFDALSADLLADTNMNVLNAVYGRDGCALVREIDKNVFQIAAFQFNYFAPGVFKKEVARFCTPLLITVTIHGKRPYLNLALQDCSISLEDIYLGKQFCGSKGELCDRESFSSTLKNLVMATRPGSQIKNVCSRLVSANYICHHIAETLGYAYGALDVFWAKRENLCFLTAFSQYDDRQDELQVEIVDNFNAEKMRSHFAISKYGKLLGPADEFKESNSLVLLEVEYKGDVQGIYIPSGYQKISKKLFNENVRVVTTQHIIEHIMADYYKRKNAFVVSNTFQIFETLSRALLAKIQGNPAEGGKFIRNASVCKGQHPEMDLEKTMIREDAKFPEFVGEFAYGMFFRPPIVT